MIPPGMCGPSGATRTEWVSAGDVPTADVIRAVVRHGRGNVVVKMTFTDLRRVEPQSYSATIVSRGRYGAVFVSAGPGGDGRDATNW